MWVSLILQFTEGAFDFTIHNSTLFCMFVFPLSSHILLVHACNLLLRTPWATNPSTCSCRETRRAKRQLTLPGKKPRAKEGTGSRFKQSSSTAWQASWRRGLLSYLKLLEHVFIASNFRFLFVHFFVFRWAIYKYLRWSTLIFLHIILLIFRFLLTMKLKWLRRSQCWELPLRSNSWRSLLDSSAQLSLV